MTFEHQMILADILGPCCCWLLLVLPIIIVLLPVIVDQFHGELRDPLTLVVLVIVPVVVLELALKYLIDRVLEWVAAVRADLRAVRLWIDRVLGK